ncbi:hypothetical protein FB451DRAFT_1569739 [Mycena latifolia]|nr:hypothetical protein FB451DRAFT_1569739 [Mycena latifolia]
MCSSSPFDIPELFEQLMQHLSLHGSATDLAACAMVKRACPKRITLFRQDDRAAQLLKIFTVSPHNTHFLVLLEDWPEVLSPETFAALSATTFNFNVQTYASCTSADRAIPLSRQRRDCSSFSASPASNTSCSPATFVTRAYMWECASPNIKHLSLSCLDPIDGPSALVLRPPEPVTAKPRMQVHSFKMSGELTFSRWVARGQSAIDLSRLRTLPQINLHACIRGGGCDPGPEALHIDVDPGRWFEFARIDLAAYARLTTLHLWCAYSLRALCGALASIPRMNCIQEIVIYYGRAQPRGRRAAVNRRWAAVGGAIRADA